MKIGVASDLHDESYAKYQHVRDTFNAQGVDAAFFYGDFFKHWEARRVERAKMRGEHRFLGWLDNGDRRLISQYSAVAMYGSVDRARMALDELEGDARTELEDAIQTYENNREDITDALDRNRDLAEFNERLLTRELERVREKLNEESFYRWAKLDKIFGEINAPVYITPGNWETDNFMEYDWQNATMLLDNVATVNGVRFAGVPNVYEQLAILPAEWYSWLDDWHDPATGGESQAGREFDMMVLREGTPEEKQAFFREGRVPLRFVENNPVYNKLKDKEFDWLVSHKEPHTLPKEGATRYGSGMGLELVLTDALEQDRLKGVVYGHRHGDGHAYRQEFNDGKSYQAIHTTDTDFKVLDIDEVSKEIRPNGVLSFLFDDAVEYRRAA